MKNDRVFFDYFQEGKFLSFNVFIKLNEEIIIDIVYEKHEKNTKQKRYWMTIFPNHYFEDQILEYIHTVQDYMICHPIYTKEILPVLLKKKDKIIREAKRHNLETLNKEEEKIFIQFVKEEMKKYGI